LQTLACAALIGNQPLRPPRRRVIVALDIENSTSRPDPVKAELRTMLYELSDAALRAAGLTARRRDRFSDRGDGLLALVDPADQALLIHLVIPVFSQLLASYNASLPHPGGSDRQLRVRVVLHAGNVHDDNNGYLGELALTEPQKASPPDSVRSSGLRWCSTGQTGCPSHARARAPKVSGGHHAQSGVHHEAKASLVKTAPGVQ
jgi:hypothetical protein